MTDCGWARLLPSLVNLSLFSALLVKVGCENFSVPVLVHVLESPLTDFSAFVPYTYVFIYVVMVFVSIVCACMYVRTTYCSVVFFLRFQYFSLLSDDYLAN